jgi:hypothetical protein
MNKHKYKTSRNLFTLYRNIRIRLFRRTPALVAVQEQCLPTNFIPFTIFVLFYRIVAIYKYSEYSETVKLGGVTNLVESTLHRPRRRAIKKTGPKLI